MEDGVIVVDVVDDVMVVACIGGNVVVDVGYVAGDVAVVVSRGGRSGCRYGSRRRRCDGRCVRRW